FPPVQARATRRGPVDPGDQVEQGRLAGAIGADDGIHDAFVHGKTDVLDGPDIAELDGNAVDFEQGHGVSPPGAGAPPGWAPGRAAGRSCTASGWRRRPRLPSLRRLPAPAAAPSAARLPAPSRRPMPCRPPRPW